MAKVRIEHVGKGYSELFRSLQPAVDEAGERIAAAANAGCRSPHFDYKPLPGPHYARGYVISDAYGARYEATDKRLTKAVRA